MTNIENIVMILINFNKGNKKELNKHKYNVVGTI